MKNVLVTKPGCGSDPATFLEDDNGGDEDRAVCEDVKKVLSDWKRQQRRFKSVYERQLRKGGIIDLEEEAKRCLVSLRVSNNDGEDGGTAAVTQPPAAPSQPSPRPATAEKTNGSTAATKESSSTNNGMYHYSQFQGPERVCLFHTPFLYH